MTNIQLKLIFQILSLGLCAFLAHLVRFKRQRLGTLFPEWALRLIYLFLVIQILLIVINIVLEQTGTSLFPADLWHLDLERNVPSILSTIYLLLLGILCLATGITSGKISWAERLYWLVLCLGITIIGLIDYGMLPRRLFNLSPRDLFMSSGLFVVAATLTLILRNSDGKRRLFLSLLLGGLGVWGHGRAHRRQYSSQQFHQSDCVPGRDSGNAWHPCRHGRVAGYVSAVAPPARTDRIVIVTGLLLFFLMSGDQINVRYGAEIERLVYSYRTLAEELLYARRIFADIDDHALQEIPIAETQHAGNGNR